MTSLTGSVQWIFKDFSTPLRPENPIPHVNEKGLVQRDMMPKEGYYVFQSYWAAKPMIHIYGHSWPTRWGEAGESKLVKVYSNCESVELFVNKTSLGTKRRNSQDFPAAGLHWLAKFKPKENVLRAIGRLNRATVEDSLTFDYETNKWGSPARIELKELARDAKSVRIEARLVDHRGNLCLDARHRLWFGVTGDGRLLDNMGISTASRNVEVYNGRAEIKLLRSDGTTVVSARCKSLAAAFLSVS